jgi:hypothetical protein
VFSPRSDKVLLALLLESEMLGIIRVGKIYRLVMFDDIRIEQEELDIYGDQWQMSLDDFIDNIRVFDHTSNPTILEHYPESTNQMMLEYAWQNSIPMAPMQIAGYVRMFRPIQLGRIRKKI